MICFKIARVVGSNSSTDIDGDGNEDDDNNDEEEDDEDDDDEEDEEDDIVPCTPLFLSFPPFLSLFPPFCWSFSPPPLSLLSPTSARRITSLALDALALLPQGSISSSNRVRSNPK